MSELAIRAELAAMVADVDYPCLGAQSVFKRNQVTLLVLDRLADPDQTRRLYTGLEQFCADLPPSAPSADTDRTRPRTE